MKKFLNISLPTANQKAWETFEKERDGLTGKLDKADAELEDIRKVSVRNVCFFGIKSLCKSHKRFLHFVQYYMQYEKKLH